MSDISTNMSDISTNTSDILERAELSGGPLANFTAMPQVGGDPIVESGSNADGEWTRWSDGTQQLRVNAPSSGWTSSSPIVNDYESFYKDATLPLPFIDTTFTFGGGIKSSTPAVRRFVEGCTYVTTSTVRLNQGTFGGVPTIAVVFTFSGRWK
jgi:hypothetical protein